MRLSDGSTTMSENIIRIATRKSPLAMWQAEFVKAELERIHTGLTVELLPMSTKGDVILDTPLAKIGGKGLFVKELEVAMLENRADIAVHSMKDLPVDFPEGLGLQVICEREDPRDAFVSNNYKSISELPQGAVVGTSSLRRQCQIRAARPDLVIKDLRGNVGTRLAKLDSGDYAAIILAAAGLIRLKLNDRIAGFISAEESLPANGQGAVGIECRTDDERVKALLAPLEHLETRYRVLAERAMNSRLEGGCQVPIGAFAEINGDTLTLRGLVGNPDGSQIVHGTVSGAKQDGIALGKSLAEDLISRGAKTILDAVYAR